VHGVFGSRRLQDAAPVEMQSTWQKSLSDEAERIRDDRLLAADDSHAACQALDGELQQFCRAHPEANLLLIAGPARRKATAQLDPSAFVPPDSRFEAEGSYLRIADALNESERSLAIRFEGIERVLHGEALLRRAGEHHEAGQAILVAEPGWCFSSSGQLFLGEGSFVAACGSQLESEAQGWPKAIHDTRIAPTRARLLSQEFTGFPERSL
jgi:hypothetical protein